MGLGSFYPWSFTIQLINKLIPSNKFKYPFYNGEIKSQLINKFKYYIHNPYAFHFWNEMWRRNDISKNKKFSKFSIFEKLKKKHKIE